MEAFICGSNNCGQLGIASGDDFLDSLQPLPNLKYPSIISCLTTLQTFVIENGLLLTSGSNDDGELVRDGKRSLLKVCDSLENLCLVGISCGDGFCILWEEGGKAYGLGKNDYGN